MDRLVPGENYQALTAHLYLERGDFQASQIRFWVSACSGRIRRSNSELHMAILPAALQQWFAWTSSLIMRHMWWWRVTTAALHTRCWKHNNRAIISRSSFSSLDCNLTSRSGFWMPWARQQPLASFAASSKVWWRAIFIQCRCSQGPPPELWCHQSSQATYPACGWPKRMQNISQTPDGQRWYNWLGLNRNCESQLGTSRFWTDRTLNWSTYMSVEERSLMKVQNVSAPSKQWCCRQQKVSRFSLLS